jgi:hypothetical protein
MSKPNIIRRFENLSDEIQSELLKAHPYGFDKKLITFKNHKGQLISALPYETDEYHYLIKMTRMEAQMIHAQEEDMDDDLTFDDLDSSSTDLPSPGDIDEEE